MTHSLSQRALLLVVSLCGSLVNLTGETAGSPGYAYRVTRWTAEQGLPENNIKALVQTRDGYLWLGTLYGLVRFDGVRFKVFDHSSTPELAHDVVNDLAEDSHEAGLWISTGSGLLYYQEHAFVRFGSDQGIPGGVGPLTASREGGVWFSPTLGQIGLVRGSEVRTWNLGPSVSDLSVDQILEETPTQLLILVAHRLYRWSSDTASVTRLTVPFTDYSCSSIRRDSAGRLWACTGSGIWSRQGDTWRQEIVADRAGPWPQRFITGADDRMWVKQSLADRSSRLRYMVDNRLELLNAPEFPADANVTSALEDREGSLWVGTAVGLFRLEPKRLKVFARGEGMKEDDVVGVTIGTDGTIWAGTAAGVSAIQHGTVINLPIREPVTAPQRCGVMLSDSKGRLWIQDQATFLRIFDGTRWLTPSITGMQSRLRGGVRALFEDQRGRIWIGTEHGVICSDGQSETVYATAADPLSEDIRVIYQDSAGDMWFGTFGGGLKRLRNGQITTYRTPSGQYGNRMWCIHEDADGVFWIGSQEGLIRFIKPDRPATGDRFFVYTTRHGLGENVINNIQEDDFGFLWLSGLRGIYRLSRQELNEVAFGRQTEVRCSAFGEADGMLSSECNGGDNQPAGCKDREGRLWFPTARGVVAVDPRQVTPKEIPPPVVIEQVLADDEVAYGDGRKMGERTAPVASPGISPEHRFKPGQARALEIHFTANSLTAPEKITFKHRLVGYDPGWRIDGNRRVVHYTNLRPGRYAFEVIASNPHGVWSPAPDQFKFYLEPYFWQTWTFYGACAGAMLGLAVAVQGYRLKWQRRLLKLEEQRALANERARIARDLHDDLGTALTGLALELDLSRREARDHAELAERFGRSAESARELAERMREVVWTINPRCDTVSGLASFLEQQVSRFLQAAGLRVRLEFPEDIPAISLSGEARHQLALAVREALTNVVRHAQASEVIITLTLTGTELVLQVQDNGLGFKASAQPGHGLANMPVRMEQVGGHFDCVSRPGEGTTLEFHLPLRSGAPGLGGPA